MELKNKADVVENLNLKDCPTLKVEGSFTVKKLPTTPFAVLNEVPNYIVVNDETDKIEFTSDSISLCTHFLAFANNKQPQQGIPVEGTMNESGENTIN